MPYCDKKKTVFLHVPKTGGTTIGRMLDIQQFQDSNPSHRPTPQHFTSRMLREALGDETYGAYYSFAFVRNPWARLLSSYFWRQQLPKKRKVLPFDDFVEHAGAVVASNDFYAEDFGDHFIPQIEYASDVDDVFRFEAFETGLRAAAARMGIDLGPVPPKPVKPHDDYQPYYSRQARDRVAEIYQADIALFGYEFDAGQTTQEPDDRSG